MSFLTKVFNAYTKQAIPEKIYKTFVELYETYTHSLAMHGISIADHEHVFDTLLTLVQEQLVHPYKFDSFHKRITHPFDYYKFGLDFIRPLVDEKSSTLYHYENIERMVQQLNACENVILLANHQTEVDPQLISLILEKRNNEFGAEMIFVAGDRVITDPMALPFSMGRNLLCIYSKRHIDNPPEKKEEKLLHNQRTMKVMREMLEEGGKCIYVAPSGGRDRPNAQGEVTVGEFDPQAIEMFRLMAKQASQPTHFYPLALATYDILPPPHKVQSELGEVRTAKREGIHFSFGNEIDMESFPGSEVADKHAKREARAFHIWNLVKKEYAALSKSKQQQDNSKTDPS